MIDHTAPKTPREQIESLITTLNTAQKAAVTAAPETMMIIAGAGSGKTRVITTRIAYLIEHYNVSPEHIVALTFTNKAGKEMQHRIGTLLPHLATRPFIGTFHSYCLALLKRSKREPFSILDADDQRSIIKTILKRFGLEKELTPARMQGMISFHKNHLPEHRSLITPSVSFFNDVFAAYEHEKKLAHALDFDDLLSETLALLRTHKREESFLISDTIRHIFVDEYQDTNQIQHALLLELKKTAESLCVVGDEDQSIYSWRGAQADNMQRFIASCSPRLYKIEQNYRSVQPILATANAVISQNSGRNDKQLWSNRPAQNRIISLACQTSGTEASLIGDLASAAHKQRKNLAEMAILYRTHQQSRLIEEALIQRGVPYTIIGGTRFYERKEVKDIIAYLRLIANPYERPSFFRILNTPTRGFGEKFQEDLDLLWQDQPQLDFRELLALARSNITGRSGGIDSFLEIFSSYERNATQLGIVSALTTLVNAINYRAYLIKQYEAQEAEERFENIRELSNALTTFITHRAPEGENDHLTLLREFLSDVALMQEYENAEEGTTLSLMTLHGAKGLEFETVIITGLEETVLPSSRALASMAELQEERRLCYVGITRAKERLLLTHSAVRTTYGTPQMQAPSRFLDEMPPEHVETLSSESPHRALTRLTNWLGLALPTMRAYAPSHMPTKAPERISHNTPVRTAQNAYQQRATSAYQKSPVSRGSVGATATRTAGTSGFSIGTPVQHATFGPGIVLGVHEIDRSPGVETYLTINFRTAGVKKIAARFVTRN